MKTLRDLVGCVITAESDGNEDDTGVTATIIVEKEVTTIERIRKELE